MNTLKLKSPKQKTTSPWKINSKSPKRATSKSPYRSTSPSNKNTKVLHSENILLESLRKTRQKICNTLDAYILIFRTDSPMRCLEHNSVLSLYCETEQKLLCANCVYKNGNHRLHKVYPLEKCYKNMARDVDIISRHSEREVSWVQNSIKSIYQYLDNEEKNANSAILALARKYDELQKDLIRSFEQSRKKIIISMEGIRAKNQSLVLELQFFKETILSNKPLDWQNLDNLQKSTSQIHQNKLIFDHLIANTILDYGKYENTKIKYDQSKISTIQQKQIRLVQQLIDMIISNKVVDKEPVVVQN